MSWLSDHLFGVPKSKDENNKDADGNASADSTPAPPSTEDGSAPSEIQNTAVTTSNSDAAAAPPSTDDATALEAYENRDVVAEWQVPVRGKLHQLEFEHGTTSGKRILWINGQEVFHRDWMFKLVGDDTFELDGLRCILRVDPAPGFKYKYSLFIDGKPLDQYKQRQAKVLRIWEAVINETNYRIVLEKDTLNIFLNGTLREEEGEFTDDGTETKWEEDGNLFVIKARNSGNKHDGLLHSLAINGAEIEEVSSIE